MYQNIISPQLEKSINKHLKGNTAKVLIHILRYYYNKQKYVAWPKQQTIADELGISIKSVKRAISTLKEKGTINIKRSRAYGQYGPFDRNTYSFPRITYSNGLIITKASIHERGHFAKSAKTEDLPESPQREGSNCPPLNKGEEDYGGTSTEPTSSSSPTKVGSQSVASIEDDIPIGNGSIEPEIPNTDGNTSPDIPNADSIPLSAGNKSSDIQGLRFMESDIPHADSIHSSTGNNVPVKRGLRPIAKVKNKHCEYCDSQLVTDDIDIAVNVDDDGEYFYAKVYMQCAGCGKLHLIHKRKLRIPDDLDDGVDFILERVGRDYGEAGFMVDANIEENLPKKKRISNDWETRGLSALELEYNVKSEVYTSQYN